MRLEQVETAAGTLHVNRTSGRNGSKGPFFRAYRDEAGDDRWGYLCGNCETADNAVDTMGRIECNRCGNIRKPEEWDAAHE